MKGYGYWRCVVVYRCLDRFVRVNKCVNGVKGCDLDWDVCVGFDGRSVNKGLSGYGDRFGIYVVGDIS